MNPQQVISVGATAIPVVTAALVFEIPLAMELADGQQSIISRLPAIASNSKPKPFAA